MRKYVKREMKRAEVFRLLASVNEAYYWDVYFMHRDVFKDMDIIYVDKTQRDYGKYVKDFFKLENGLISSCFYADNLKVINEKVLMNNIKGEQSKIFTSFDVQLDTNVVSELDNMIRKKEFPKHHKKDLLSLTKKREMHSTISIGPYICENYYNNGYELNDTMIDVYKNFLLTLNKNSYSKYSEAVIKTKKQTSQFIDFYENTYMSKEIFEMNDNLFKAIYLNLLKMVELSKTKLSVKEKVYKLFEFQNYKIYRYLLGEINIAVDFFEKGYKISFFGKLQSPKKENLLNIIKNMAWDIYHLRNLEFTMGLMEYEKTDFVFPMLFSFDKKFNELRRSSGLRLFINDRTSNNFYPYYMDDKFNKYIDVIKMKKVIGDKSKKRRLRKASKVNLDDLINDLEKQVLSSYN